MVTVIVELVAVALMSSPLLLAELSFGGAEPNVSLYECSTMASCDLVGRHHTVLEWKGVLCQPMIRDPHHAYVLLTLTVLVDGSVADAMVLKSYPPNEFEVMATELGKQLRFKGRTDAKNLETNTVMGARQYEFVFLAHWSGPDCSGI